MATGDSTHPGHGDPANPPATRTELVDTDTGRWQITTETSIYLLDLDARTMLRVPGVGSGVQRDPTRGHIAVTSLAGDHHVVPLFQVVYCRVGVSMYLLTEPRRDGTVMVRGTIPVREIRPLHPTSAKHRSGQRS